MKLLNETHALIVVFAGTIAAFVTANKYPFTVGWMMTFMFWLGVFYHSEVLKRR